MNFHVQRFGKTIVEKDVDGEILICLPDGGIEFARSPAHAKEIHVAWQQKRTTSVGVAEIEWRGFAPGEVPS